MRGFKPSLFTFLGFVFEHRNDCLLYTIWGLWEISCFNISMSTATSHTFCCSVHKLMKNADDDKGVPHLFTDTAIAWCLFCFYFILCTLTRMHNPRNT
jgi:uncharacterized protein with PQ loop repeat